MFQLDSQEKAEVVANCDHLAKKKADCYFKVAVVFT